MDTPEQEQAARAGWEQKQKIIAKKAAAKVKKVNPPFEEEPKVKPKVKLKPK